MRLHALAKGHCVINIILFKLKTGFMRTKKLLFALLFFIFSGGIFSQLMSQIAYDGFDGNPGDPLNGLNSGYGFGSPWNVMSGTGEVSETTPFSYGDLVTTSKYTASTSVYSSDRKLDTIPGGAFDAYLDADNNIGKVGTTLYMSYLMKVQNNGAWSNKLGLKYRKTDSPDIEIRINSQKQWCIKQGDSIFTENQTNIGDVVLMVMKIDFVASDYSSVSYWLNPTDLATEPAPDMVIDASNWVAGKHGLRFRYIHTSSFHNDLDEIRFGSTYNEVLPLGPATIPVDSVVVSPEIATIQIGEAVTLSSTVYPTDATDDTVSWASRDESIATVVDGIVTGVSVGSTYVVVTTQDGGHMDSTQVTVNPVLAESVQINESNPSVVVSNTTTLTETVLPISTTDKTVTWDTRDASIATVSGGIVTGVAAGSTYIVVTTNDGTSLMDSVQVTVTLTNVAVDSVVVSPETATIEIGGTVTLSETIYPNNATNKGVVWESRDASVATVSTDGIVTGESGGTTYIVVVTNDGGLMDSALVTVTAQQVIPVKSVTIDQANPSVEVDATITLTATVEPGDATNPAVTWESLNTSIATVSSAGVVTGVAEGSAQIVATADGVSDTVEVAVTLETTIEELSSISNVYPNPASDFVHVSLKKAITGTANIISLTGQVVVSENIENSLNLQFNVKNLAGGLYFIQVSSDGKSEFSKLVVK